MIDLHDLRARPEAYIEACRKKRIKFDVSAFLTLDQEYRTLKTAVETDRAEQNRFTKELPSLSGAEKETKLQVMRELSKRLKQDQERLTQLEQTWSEQQLRIPSIPDERVPEGKDDSENLEMRKVGTPKEFNFTPLDHVELGKRLDLFDIERGVKIAGARNYVLRGEGTRLQHAVLALAMDLLYRKKYTLIDPPHIVRREAMVGTGYFPGGEEQAYALDERDAQHYLIGTSEVSVCAMHQDEILDEKDLPIRYGGYSPCYRREAGTYGKDTQGLYRIHQFYKIEQVIICRADIEFSSQMHAELLGNAEELLALLELPYRVVAVCSGDMGQGQVYKNDIETWMPSRKSYGETHSCSTFLEYQARRLQLRYRNSQGKVSYCHTLNNTLVASPRILIALLENHQNSDGSINIPSALRPYMSNCEKIFPRTA